MKKLLKVTLFVAIFVMLTLALNTTNAETFDSSKYSIKWVTGGSADTESWYPTYIKINGLDFNTETTRYYVITSDKEFNIKYPSDLSNSDFSGDGLTLKCLYNENSSIYVPCVLEKSAKKVYIQVYKYDKNDTSISEPKLIINTKIDPAPDLPLSQRLYASFFNDSTFFHIYYNDGLYKVYNGNSELNIKIGKIDDINILKDIKDGKSSGLSNLLSHAKNDTKPVTTISTTVPENIKFKDVINLDGLIENRAYYYVYFEIPSNDGKRAIEDVGLYYGCVGPTVGTNLFSFLSKDFQWHLEDSNTGDSPSVLPDTGEFGIILAVIGVVTLISFGIYTKKKLKF